MPRGLLLDTRQSFDAGWLGFDRPCDPRTDGEGLILALAACRRGRPELILEGPEGEVRLLGERQIDGVLAASAQALALFRKARA